MNNLIKTKKLTGLIYPAKDINLDNLPKTDCHLHTSWTDGEASVTEVYKTAVACNLDTILFSEHSRKTSIDWFKKFADEVRCLPSSPCRAYVGTEVKVETFSGNIDTSSAITDHCDFIMASVHRFVDENENIIQFKDTKPAHAINYEFELTWAALSNPQVDILGHMFGMSYRRFDQTPSDNKIYELIARAVEFNVAIEINSYYHPDTLRLLRMCQGLNANVSFGSNAHKLSEVGDIIRKLKKELASV